MPKPKTDARSTARTTRKVATTPPSPVERQKKRKLWNVVCKAMLDRRQKTSTLADCYGVARALKRVTTPAKPKFHRVCDHNGRFKAAYTSACFEGMKSN